MTVKKSYNKGGIVPPVMPPDVPPETTKKSEKPKKSRLVPKRGVKKKTAKTTKKKTIPKTSTKITVTKEAPVQPEPVPGKGGSTGPKGIPWEEVRNYYITALRHVTLRTLAAHYKVNPKTVRIRAAREKWKEKRDLYWQEAGDEYLDIVKKKVSAIKLENLDIVRSTKRILAKKYISLLNTWGVDPTAGDLVRLIKMELSLLGEADIKVDTGQNTEAMRESLLEALTDGKITRENLRDAVRRVIPSRPPD